MFYQASLPLSAATLRYVARLIRSHRAAIGSRWRVLDPGQQALLTLVWLRKGEPYADLAPGFAISTATVARRVNETVDLLAARAPGARAALRAAKHAGAEFVIVDGTLIGTDRLAADGPFYAGKHRCHGMNVQAIATARGDLLWISGAIRGSVHDTKAAQIRQIPALLRAAGLPALADKGYHGLDAELVATPYKGRNKPAWQRRYNRLHAKLRAPGERVFAELKKWRIPRKLRCCPQKAITIARAITVLNHQQQSG